MTERRPTPESKGWERFRVAPAAGVMSISGWRRGDITVISALELAEYPDGIGTGPQLHVSIARGINRARPKDIEIAAKAFRCRGWEEDNHHPGAARHFWMPLDPTHRAECQCKASEDVIRERDGYTWTNPKSGGGGGCRGCEWGLVSGRACPIHGAMT